MTEGPCSHSVEGGKANNAVDARSLFSVLACRLNLSWEEVEALLGREEVDALSARLLVPARPAAQVFVVKALHEVMRRLPPSARYRLVDALKAMWACWAGGGSEAKGDAGDSSNTVQTGLPVLQGRGGDGRFWNGHGGVVCMTHDVDYLSCYDFVPELAAMDLEYGVSATYNFLTGWDYELDDGLLVWLRAQGFEIGLHGTTHDIGLGYRGKKRIDRELAQGLNRLAGYGVTGFRAPALSISPALFSALAAAGFRYDSSVSGICRIKGAVWYCYPYRYSVRGIWEIPLAVQDTYLFREKGLNDREAVAWTMGIVRDILALGGVAVLNCHPCIIMKHQHFYRWLLEEIAGLEGVWQPCLGACVDYLEMRTENVQG